MYDKFEIKLAQIWKS